MIDIKSNARIATRLDKEKPIYHKTINKNTYKRSIHHNNLWAVYRESIKNSLY